MRRVGCWKIVFAGAVLCVGGCTLWRIGTEDARNIEIAREWGRLAPLPASARGVRTAGWQSLFTGNVRIKFRAEAAEIESFLADSPGLKGVAPDRFTPKHMYLPYERSFDKSTEPEEYTRHQHFQPAKEPWFDPTIRVKGRLYEIPQDGFANGGRIVVDDVAHLVFIDVSHS